MLSKKQNNILEYLYRHNNSKMSTINKKFDVEFKHTDGALNDLLNLRYIRRFYKDNILYFMITEKGRACVEEELFKNKELRMRKAHDWINTLIAIISLLTAIGGIAIW